MAAIHKGIKYPCTKCNYKATNKGYLKQHVAAHDVVTQNIADKHFHCQKCEKRFSSQGALYNHNKSSHEGVKYPCTECNYKATQKGHLKQHVAENHA